jgi:hypothetical protein
VTPAFSVYVLGRRTGAAALRLSLGQPESDMLAMSLADLTQGRHSCRFKVQMSQNIEAMVLEARADARRNAH